MEKAHMCIACGNVFPADMDMCPRRYLSNHTDEHIKKMVYALLRLGWNGSGSPTRELFDLALSEVIPH